MKVYDFPQGSDAWLQCRVGKITASRFKDARDRSTGLTAQQALYVAAIRDGHSAADAMAVAGYKKAPSSEAVEKALAGKLEFVWGAKATGYAAQVAVERIAQRPVDKVFLNWQMREGQEQEPHARNAYDVETGNVVQEVGAIGTDDDLFLYSPDGLIGTDGLLEIKTLLSPDVILRVIGNGDLSDYMDQCIGGLWLTGRKWIDLVLWAPALEPIGRALTIHHITRDEDAIEALEADLLAFAAVVRKYEALLTSSHIEAQHQLQAEVA